MHTTTAYIWMRVVRVLLEMSGAKHLFIVTDVGAFSSYICVYGCRRCACLSPPCVACIIRLVLHSPLADDAVRPNPAAIPCALMTNFANEIEQIV